MQLFSPDEQNTLFEITLNNQQIQHIDIGKNAVINLITIHFKQSLPTDTLLPYNFIFDDGQEKKSLATLCPELRYSSNLYPHLVINTSIKQLLHGSCRKPHFDSQDALAEVDRLLSQTTQDIKARPAMLMLSGDQIYADDVCGPMLVAIHQLIDLLGLHDEQWQGAKVNNSESLFASSLCYYQRDKLLPYHPNNKNVYDKFFAAAKKPIFSSDTAHNHLITLAEVFAMYILVWSPTMWRFINLQTNNIAPQFLPQYQQEMTILEDFTNTLPAVSRALAHLPTYMIFDDHDITDDWNLTRGWEEAAYGHPFSKRVIGNTLIAYWLCQGWGNAPDKFTSLTEQADQYFSDDAYDQQDKLIEQLLAWKQWHYHLATNPKVVVLDTRTQRWRSESNSNKPSGLMDWEALSELQQELIDQEEVILISPAPIYGVKMIETVQRIFTFIGRPLLVDAENWMAHPGTANVMLNIFRHKKTPPHFIILSGDVHYSFFYEISHRFKDNHSRIYQITASGIKNQFPSQLLTWLERFNRHLYASSSPLNWFTKRRRMKVKVRLPDNQQTGTLVNQSGIGLITLLDDENVVEAELLTASQQRIKFIPLNDNKSKGKD